MKLNSNVLDPLFKLLPKSSQPGSIWPPSFDTRLLIPHSHLSEFIVKRSRTGRERVKPCRGPWSYKNIVYFLSWSHNISVLLPSCIPMFPTLCYIVALVSKACTVVTFSWLSITKTRALNPIALSNTQTSWVLVQVHQRRACDGIHTSFHTKHTFHCRL